MLKYLPHLIKSFIFCVRYFPLNKAIYLPVLVHRKVEFKCLKGKVFAPQKIGSIKIGFSNSEIASRKDITTLNFQENAEIHFEGSATIGNGSRISIKGKCVFGDGFIISRKATIICEYNIIFKSNVLVSWDTLIMDTNQHQITLDNIEQPIRAKIIIGSKVWIGSKSTILKDTNVSHGSIIASNSLVNNQFLESNILIAGIPAKIIKHKVSWDY